MAKRYAIYVRVSTQEQTNENQKIRLKEYAKREGYRFKIFEEVESTRKSRPVKAELLNRLRQKEFKGVIIYKFDRWARSLQELIMDMNELVSKNIKFISLKENIDLSTAAGKFQFHILGAFAEFERELIRERTLEGLNRAKKQGKTLGRPKGAKDIKKRKKGGYYLRYMKEK